MSDVSFSMTSPTSWDPPTFWTGDAVQKAYKAGCCCVQLNLTGEFIGLAPAWQGTETRMDKDRAGDERESRRCLPRAASIVLFVISSCVLHAVASSSRSKFDALFLALLRPYGICAGHKYRKIHHGAKAQCARIKKDKRSLLGSNCFDQRSRARTSYFKSALPRRFRSLMAMGDCSF